MSAFLSFPDESALRRDVNLLNALGAALAIITSIAVLARVWVRTRLIKCWGKDDWAILMSQVNPYLRGHGRSILT